MAEGMIRVECECGKAARVPARYAGRMVKCSGCGGKITIPNADDPAGPAAEGSEGSEGSVGGPVGGVVGSRIGGGGGESPSGRQERRPSGQRDRPASGQRGRPPSGQRERPARGGDRGGTPDYGVPARRRSASSGTHDPYAPPTADVDENTYRRGPQKGSRERPRDLEAEAHIMAIGIWQRIKGVLYIALACLGVIGAGLGAIGGARGGVPAGLMIGMAFGAVIVFGISGFIYYTGVAMMKYDAWSRIAFAVLFVLGLGMSALGLLAGDVSQICWGGVGVVYGGAQLWALFSQRANRVFSPGYVQSTRHDRRPVPWAKSPFFWIPCIGIALIFGLCLLGAVMAMVAR